MEAKYLIAEIEKAIQGMREAVEDTKNYGIILQMVNYSHCCGNYYAYLDALSETDTKEFLNVYDKLHNEVEELARAFDGIYCKLKSICGID